MAYEDENVLNEVAALRARLAELEERVSRLEAPGVAAPVSVSRGTGAAAASTDPAGLAEAISQALEGLGEADAGAIRQQLIKNGFGATLARSDVNKALYANPTRFQVVRQEGAKPIWKRADA